MSMVICMTETKVEAKVEVRAIRNDLPFIKPKSHPGMPQKRKRRVYTDYSIRQPLTDLRVECKDGTLFFYSKSLEHIAVIWDSLINGKCDGSILLECTIETANDMFNLIESAKPLLRLSEERAMNVFNVLHRYNGIRKYMNRLVEWCERVPRKLVFAAAEYGYGLDNMASMWLNEAIVIGDTGSSRFPIQWYESVLKYTIDRTIIVSNRLLQDVLPYIAVGDMSVIRYEAMSLLKLSYMEYCEVGTILARLPYTGSIPILIDEMLDIGPLAADYDGCYQPVSFLDRAKLINNIGAPETENEKTFDRVLVKYLADRKSIKSTYDSAWSVGRQRVETESLGFRCDMKAEFVSYMQETKDDGSAFRWMTRVVRRHFPDSISRLHGLSVYSNDGLLPAYQHACAVVTLDLLAVGRCSDLSKFKLCDL